MKRSIILVALVAATALAGPASAYTVKGSVDCPTILVEHDNETYRAMNRWWLLGYFSARNYTDEADVGAGVDEFVLYDTAYKFCTRNADAYWDDAAIFTYREFGAK